MFTRRYKEILPRVSFNFQGKPFRNGKLIGSTIIPTSQVRACRILLLLSEGTTNYYLSLFSTEAVEVFQPSCVKGF
jgi:hypothetical protein